MLSDAYFLAKFRFDAAENEPAKNLQNSFASPAPLSATRPQPEEPERHGPDEEHGEALAPRGEPVTPVQLREN